MKDVDCESGTLSIFKLYTSHTPTILPAFLIIPT